MTLKYSKGFFNDKSYLKMFFIQSIIFYTLVKVRIYMNLI